MNASNVRTHVVVGVFTSRHAADACFHTLLSRGYPHSEINLMMSERVRTLDYNWKDQPGAAEAARSAILPRSLSPEPGPHGDAAAPYGTTAGSQAAEGTALGGSMGAAVGATIAAIAAAGTSLVIPGLNVIVAGPIFAALVGAGAGAVTGGLVGGLIGLGISEQDAEVYNKALAEGGVLMSVATRNSSEAADVKELMLEHSGEQVACNVCG